MRLPKSSTIVILVAVVGLAVLGVLPSRRERWAWSAEKRLLFSLGTVALLVGWVVVSSKLEARRKRLADRDAPGDHQE